MPLLLAALALAGCGGGGSNGGGAPPGVVVSPTPSPTPTATPTPTPSPLVADTTPGQSLFAPRVCAEGSFTFAPEANATRRLTAINSISNLSLGNGSNSSMLEILYRAADTYEVAFTFDDRVDVDPSHKRAPLTTAYDYFRSLTTAFNSNYEFEIYRNGTAQRFNFVTLGRISLDTLTCFYVAGRIPSPLPGSGVSSYDGIADGVGLQGGRTTRLFGSAAAATVDFAQGTATVRIDLASREPAFGEFLAATPAPVGQATAQLTLVGGADTAFRSAPLAGPNGSTGTITGIVFGGGAALGFVFELPLPNGDRYFGVAAVERP
jgi:hypothetical protein